ncbi:MAG: c-type cytochrome [Verrucomicrobiota bacterium]
MPLFRLFFLTLAATLLVPPAAAQALPAGTTLGVLASPQHPGTSNPAALAFADDGGIFVTGGSGTVRLLRDQDGDGKPEAASVFAAGFSDALDGDTSGLLHYEGTVYLGSIPKIHALQHGKANGRTTLADGFGTRISTKGHGLNGFALGLDGRIWGTVGDRGFKVTTREGKTFALPNQGAVFRFDPDGSNFEVVHTGLRNPGGIAFNEWGDAFVVDTGSGQGDVARLIHVMEGADSGWETEHHGLAMADGGLDLRPPSRWMNENTWRTATPGQPAWVFPPVAHITHAPRGLAYHPGTGFLESEAGRFLVCDDRGAAANSGIWSFAVEPEGAGMKLSGIRKFAWGIAAMDVDYSWDGRAVIADSEAGVLSINPGSNRWKAADADSTARLMREGIAQRSGQELAILLGHPDLRIRLRAQIALTRKNDALPRLATAAGATNLHVRIHGIRGLGILARRGPSPLPGEEFTALPAKNIQAEAERALSGFMDDKDERIRLQAARALIDASVPGAPPLDLAPWFGDSSPRVICAVTILAGKRKLTGLYGEICEMLVTNAGKDRWLSHAGAYALSFLGNDPKLLTGLVFHESEHVRLAAVVALRRMRSDSLAPFIRDPSPLVSAEAIRAACDLALPISTRAAINLLDALDAAAKQSSFMQRRLIHAAFRTGGDDNARRLFAVAASPDFPADTRIECLGLLGQWNKPFTGHGAPLPPRDPAPVLAGLAKHTATFLADRGPVLAPALELIRAVAPETSALTNAFLTQAIADPQLPPNARAAAIRLLAVRSFAQVEPRLTQLVTDPADEVAFSAVEILLDKNPANAAAVIQPLLSPQRATLVQKIIALLALRGDGLLDSAVPPLLGTTALAQGRTPVALDVIEWARMRSHANPEIAAALKSCEEAIAADHDPLARWFPTLQGGDAKNGQALFASHPGASCMQCHRTDGEKIPSTDAAPNLSGISHSNTDPRGFLESLIKPAAAVAPGFGTTELILTNDAKIFGTLLATDADTISIESGANRWRLRRTDIRVMSPPTTSMPSMENVLTPREMRDIIAWLSTLPETPTAAPAPTEFPLLDPASLLAKTPIATTPNPAIMATGKIQFAICATCHGASGEGGAAGPPLAGSEWVTGNPENLIRIQLRGLHGPIQVKGTTYHFPAGMAPLAYQNDEQIAAVLTYIRNSFGNSAPPVTPQEVTALRGEAGKPRLVASDLIAPAGVTITPTSPGKYDDLPAADRSKKIWIIAGGAAAILVLCVLMRPKTPRKP